jgi:hypothetical protein
MLPGQPNPAAQAAPAEGGLDIEGQIRDGVSAFMQSQDPAIAVEVVTMLAEMLGIAPNIDPFQDQAAMPGQSAGTAAPMGDPMMAKRGMKIYRIGGRIVKVPNSKKKV